MAVPLKNQPRAVARALPGGRLHLQDGPIDIVLKAWGGAGDVARAYDAAIARFATILDELVAELRELRRPMAESPRVSSPVGLRMARACEPFADHFITPMASVAGSVADELLAAMRAVAPLDRAFVNNGGDIAVHVAPAHDLSIGLVGDVGCGLAGALDGAARITFESEIGGVATSGWPGRSFSLGIADAVTTLARDAAAADAAATMIANAVDIDSGKIRRASARSLDPDSDLGERLVTVDVGDLSGDEIELALTRGAARAKEIQARGLINDAALMLKGRLVVLDAPLFFSSSSRKPRKRLSRIHRAAPAWVPGSRLQRAPE